MSVSNVSDARPADDSVICFEEGVIGVPRARRFELLERPDSPVRVLRCLDVEGFSLPVVDPRLADPDYSPQLAPRLVRALKLEPEDNLLLLAVTALETEGAVANLRAPMVINVRLRLAAQVLRLGPEDEVICSPITFWGSVEALWSRRVRIRYADGFLPGTSRSIVT